MLVAKLLSKIFKNDGVILIDYDGQKYICGEPKNNNPITGKDLINACQKLLNGAAQETNQIPSLGCNIKWKAGKEPKGFSN